jgi:hypothetical protein
MYKGNYARIFYIIFKNGFKIEAGEQYLSNTFEKEEIPKIIEAKKNKEMYYFDEHLSCQWIDCCEIISMGFKDRDKSEC